MNVRLCSLVVGGTVQVDIPYLANHASIEHPYCNTQYNHLLLHGTELISFLPFPYRGYTDVIN